MQTRLLAIGSLIALTAAAQMSTALSQEAQEKVQPNLGMPVTICSVDRKLSDQTRGISDHILRSAPFQFPEQCLYRAGGDDHSVDLMFDVSAKGDAENICVMRTDHSCFNKYAVDHLKSYEFLPFTAEGKAVRLENTALRMTFRMAPPNAPENPQTGP